MPYKYIVEQRASLKIWSFYRNVALKYRHTFAEEDVVRNVQNAVRHIKQIEQSLSRRHPTIRRWLGWYMAHYGHWYYAYSIDGDTIVVHDACHQQNMHD